MKLVIIAFLLLSGAAFGQSERWNAAHWRMAPSGMDLVDPDGSIVGMVRKTPGYPLSRHWQGLVIHDKGGEDWDIISPVFDSKREAKEAVTKALHEAEVVEEIE